MKLTDMSYAKDVMERNGVFPKKKFGQNFLISDRVVENIAAACSDDTDIGVLEIGPGIGTLTVALAERYKKVVSIEIDKTLLPVLAETVGDYPNAEIINDDAMKIDYSELIKEKFCGMRVCVCANLPYYITSPIIMRLLENGGLFESITVMIQKEVAQRLTASPGSSDYGLLTVISSLYAKTERLFNVSPGSFYPVPKVTSSVIKMFPHTSPPVEVKDIENMKKIVEAAFAQRRKMLCVALSSATDKHDKAEITEKISYIGLSPDIRGERLSLMDFARQSDILEM